MAATLREHSLQEHQSVRCCRRRRRTPSRDAIKRVHFHVVALMARVRGNISAASLVPSQGLPNFRPDRCSRLIDQQDMLLDMHRGQRTGVARCRSIEREAKGQGPLSRDRTDPVTLGLRASARRLIAVAVFSGVINLLMLSGSIYMLQVYDRVIPSRNVATLVGLSLIVLLAYMMQGYFDALRTRMLSRIGTLFDVGLQEPIHLALATLPLRGVKPVLTHQPLRDLDQVRAFLSGI